MYIYDIFRNNYTYTHTYSYTRTNTYKHNSLKAYKVRKGFLFGNKFTVLKSNQGG